MLDRYYLQSELNLDLNIFFTDVKLKKNLDDVPSDYAELNCEH